MAKVGANRGRPSEQIIFDAVDVATQTEEMKHRSGPRLSPLAATVRGNDQVVVVSRLRNNKGLVALLYQLRFPFF